MKLNSVRMLILVYSKTLSTPMNAEHSTSRKGRWSNMSI